jgi:hypothetical protein
LYPCSGEELGNDYLHCKTSLGLINGLAEKLLARANHSFHLKYDLQIYDLFKIY